MEDEENHKRWKLHIRNPSREKILTKNKIFNSPDMFLLNFGSFGSAQLSIYVENYTSWDVMPCSPLSFS